MPAGYTYNIKDDISFEEFVLQCARAFGALVSMRDEKPNAPIPDEFIPSTYHPEIVAELREELEQLEKLTPKEAELAVEKEYNNQLKRQKEQIDGVKKLKMKYVKMLQYVTEWEPPTDDHKELKDFMMSQIYDSIKHDCNLKYLEEKIEKISGEQWLKDQIDTLNESIAYHMEYYKKEVETCKKRTTWIQKLKKSLVYFDAKNNA